MKKFRGIICILFSVVLAISLVGCKKKKDEGSGSGSQTVEPPAPDVITLSEVKLDADPRHVKTVYNLDEEFTYTGLKVSYIEMNETKGEELAPVSVELTDENLTIDSSKFKKGVEGTYAITVSYTKNEVTKSAAYEVRVSKAAGLVMEKTAVDYTLQNVGTDTVIDISDLKVYMANANGKYGEPLSSDAYTLSYYKNGTEKVELKEEKLVAETAGAYQIWATVSDYHIPGDPEDKAYDISSFVLVYVTDALESISFNDTAEGTVVTQKKSVIDRMSSTWTYTAHYHSGRTADLTYEDVTVSLDTNTETASGSASVAYDTYNCKGAKETANTTVAYTVTAPTVAPASYAFVYTRLPEETRKQDTILEQADFDASPRNSFLTIASGTVKSRPGTDGGILELKGDALSVTFTGVGTLKISIRSAGKTKFSAIALVAEDGSYAVGNYTSSDVAKDDSNNIYTVTGDFNDLTFTVLKPGKYTLCTFDSAFVNGAMVDASSAPRILAINMVDEPLGEGN